MSEQKVHKLKFWDKTCEVVASYSCRNRPLTSWKLTSHKTLTEHKKECPKTAVHQIVSMRPPICCDPDGELSTPARSHSLRLNTPLSARQTGNVKMKGGYLCSISTCVRSASTGKNDWGREVQNITGTQTHTYTNTKTQPCLWDEFDADVQWKAEVVH